MVLGGKFKAEEVPAAGFQEPSEPSDVKPGDMPRAQLMSEQGENPQLMAHRKGAQASDRGRGSGKRLSERRRVKSKL